MREIKFRAWHELNKTMVYFNPKRLTEDHFQATYLVKLMNGDFGDVLMQYTGLKDKNGKEIYEGDIISFNILTFEVEKHLGAFGYWVYKGANYAYFVPFCGVLKNNSMVFEIIGNIHENPELLELIK
jgi:uncharacterized phage protein (TIGR01671 family)